MADELKYTVLDVPDTNPFNIQGTKKFVFNQTGNILVSTTVEKMVRYLKKQETYLQKFQFFLQE